MKDFFKTFIVYGLATFIDKLVVLFFIPVYAKHLTVQEFGNMDLVQSIISIVSIFVFLQLEASLQRYFYEFDEKRLKLFASTIIYFVAILSVILILLFMAISFFSNPQIIFGSIPKDVLLLGMWQIPFICLYTLSTILLRFSKKYNLFFRIIIISFFVNILFPYFLVVKYQLGLKGFFQAQLASMLVVSVFSFYNARSYLVTSFSMKDLKIALNYALPQFPARIGNVLNSYANRFAITGFMDTYSLGIFALAIKISSVIQIIYHFFISFWNQIIFEIKSKENHREILILMFQVVNALVFFIISILSLFSEDIVDLISKKFSKGYYLIGIISFSFGLLIVKEVIDIGPKYLMKSKYLTINTAFSVFFNILSLLILVPLLGLFGVGLSFVISNSSLLIVSWYNSNKLYTISFNYFNLIINSFPSILIIFLCYSILGGQNLFAKAGVALALLLYYLISFIIPFKKLLRVYT